MLELDKIYNMDCLDGLQELDSNSIDTIITDPPYGLHFMGKKWDYSIPSVEIWQECLRVLKPGGTLLCFAGSRTQHRMAVNVEDAGFILKDCIMWLYGCVPEETQILTCNGWKDYTSIKKGEKVFSFNVVNERIETDEIKEIYEYGYKGGMILLKNDNTEQLLTPNHRVYCKEGLRKQNDYKRKYYIPQNWSWQYAEQIKNYGVYDLPLGAVYDGYLSIGIDFASLLGWILSEGNFQGDAINLYQSSSNFNKVLIIKELLDKLKIKHSHYKKKRKYKERYYIEHQFYFSGVIVKKIKEWIPNKKPTNELLNLRYDEKIALFNSLMLGDGSKKGKGNYITFYQNDLKSLEWFQTLCHLIGKQARINKKKMCVEVHHNPNTQIQARHLKNRVKNYDGIVWCPKTNNGTWIAKYKERIFITGNSGFPKATDISKQLDKGHKRKIGKDYIAPDGGKRDLSKHKPHKESRVADHEYGYKTSGYIPSTLPNTQEAKLWNGWKSHGLKPAYEPILVAMKPNDGSYANNALIWGVSGLNIDGCRIKTEREKEPREFDKKPSSGKTGSNKGVFKMGDNQPRSDEWLNEGRYPANIILDEVSAEMLDEQSGESKGFDRPNLRNKKYKNDFIDSDYKEVDFSKVNMYKDKGGASRFFYVAKASKSERGNGNNHPTVKPLKLMKYLCTLTKPPTDSIVLDPFMGSGTTALACRQTGRHYIGFEIDKNYYNVSLKRLLNVPKRLDSFGI